MKSKGDQKQEFNITMLLAITLAALLAFGAIGVLYGCMQNSQSSGSMPHAEMQYLVFSA